MVSMNKKITHNVSRLDIMSLRRPELKNKEVLNRKIFRRGEVLLEVLSKLSKKGLCKINELENRKKSAFNQKIFKIRT